MRRREFEHGFYCRRDGARTIRKRADAVTLYKVVSQLCGTDECSELITFCKGWAARTDLAERKARRWQAELLLAIGEGEPV